MAHQAWEKFEAQVKEVAPAHATDPELRSLLAREPLFGSSLEWLLRFEAEPQAAGVEGRPSGIVAKCPAAAPRHGSGTRPRRR